MKPIGANVELLEGCAAPMPYLIPSVARQFRLLRALVLDQSGIDFLATCADVMRALKYKSAKSGVANRSWHKTGRAFDCDQSSPSLVIVQEAKINQIFFRTYLKSNKDGEQMTVKDIRGNLVSARLFDFTAAAESLGWQRIPAWKGWSTHGSGYNKLEFWHLQITDGLTWNQAMDLAYPTPGIVLVEPVLGKNDRGPAVRRAQLRYVELGFLAFEQADGVFGVPSDIATRAFQTARGLTVDGLIGPATWKELNK